MHTTLSGFCFTTVFTLTTCAFMLYEFIETLEMHYCSFQIILDPIMVEFC
jgi:hypothetical protein